MDRDGLKAPDKSEQKIDITFTDGFDVGMPDDPGEPGEPGEEGQP